MRRTAIASAAVLGAVVALLGCAAAPEPRHGPAVGVREESIDARYDYECDTVSGTTVCVMTGNALQPLAPRYPMITLGAVKREAGGTTRYFLRVAAINMGSWVDIRRGPSLRLTVDGETLDLSGDGSAGNRMAGEAGKHFEAATYPVAPELIARLGSAKSVAARVAGGTVVEKRFGPVNQAYFAMFRRKYMEGAPGPAAGAREAR
ncbi:MAG TPA: hypothetical protein VI078_03845 [bacterium]